MILNISKNDILQFWTWFSENSNKLEIENLDSEIVAQFDDKIAAWKLTWEIGPGKTKTNSLCISPGGNLSLIGDTKEIISCAPKLLDWEFEYYKQAKVSWSKVYTYDKDLSIDASDWTYVLLEYANGKLELILKAENLSGLDKQTTHAVVDIVLTNLLGEKSHMEGLSFMEIVHEFDDPVHLVKAGPLANLPAHLRLLSSSV